MARPSETRTRVRALATELASQGIEPTPTLVRERLGKGSPNTIVTELRAWRQSLAPRVAESSAPYAETRLAMTEMKQLLAEMAVTVTELSRKLKEGQDEMGRPASANPAPTGDLQALGARLEGLQKYMLMQVNEAREEAIRWQQKHQHVKEEFGQWQTAMRQKFDALSAENAWLKGRLEEPLTVASAPRPASARPPERTLQRYSGHPRAATGYDDEG